MLISNCIIVANNSKHHSHHNEYVQHAHIRIVRIWIDFIDAAQINTLFI